ncbi:PstS family phosphate ABC transporter substrate-binding protein [Sphingomonas sp.]|uniref:PstS family phosphate ABC transporter substrate-binding protein n=1 Tax=Sphingomonas sp. TaxID=28214 RepID=UPI003B00FD8F
MRLALLSVLLLAACSRAPVAGPGPHQIRLVGATAGLPFAEDVAERFTLAAADSIAPLAQADGSASGIARFCGGLGAAHPDLVIATRPLSAAERRGCAIYGVARIAQIRFGWSALTIVARTGEGPPVLTRAQLAAAVSGPAARWSDIDVGLAPASIALYGPAARTISGDGLALPARTRGDGGYHPLGADAELVATTVARTPGAIGLVPFAYATREGLRVVPVDGVTPTAETIASGRYPLRIPLFLMVKAGEARSVPGMAALLRLFAASIDPGGAFARAGLVPLGGSKRATAKRALASIAGAA